MLAVDQAFYEVLQAIAVEISQAEAGYNYRLALAVLRYQTLGL